MTTGFYARTRQEERLCEGLFLDQLVAIEDVTARVRSALPPGGTDVAVAAAIEQTSDTIEKECGERTRLTCQVVMLFQGGQYQLYQYRRYQPVKLVFAPELQAGFFGGDPDNFTYPRYALDVSFVRAYEANGAPVRTANYFRWDADGAPEEELVFVTGNPGSTGRLLTKAQMEYMRDAEYPVQLDFVDSQLAIVKAFAAQDARFEQRMRPQILNLENTQKAFRGYHKGLLDPTLMQQKEAADPAFRPNVMAKPELAQSRSVECFLHGFDSAASKPAWARR